MSKQDLNKTTTLADLSKCEDGSCASGISGHAAPSQLDSDIDTSGFKARIGNGMADVLFAPKYLTRNWCTCTHFFQDDGAPVSPAAKVDFLSTDSYAYSLKYDSVKAKESESLYLVVDQGVLVVYLLNNDDPVAQASAPLAMLPFQGPALKSLAENLIQDGAFTEEAQVALRAIGISPSSSHEDSMKVLLRDMAYFSYACLVASMLIDSSDLGTHLFTSFDGLFDVKSLEMAALSPAALDYLSLLKVRVIAPGKSMVRILSSVASNGYGVFTSQYVQASELGSVASKGQLELAIADKKIDSLLIAVAHNADGISEMSSLQVANVNQLVTDVAKLKHEVKSTAVADLKQKVDQLSEQLKDTTQLTDYTRDYLQQLGVILNRALK